MKRSLRFKLLAGFVLVAMFTGALGLYSVAKMQELNDGQRTLFGDVFGGTHLLALYVDDSWEARASVLNYLLAHDPAERQALRLKMTSIDAKLERLASDMDLADTDRQDVATLAAVTRAWTAYADWRDTSLIGAVEAGDEDAALASYHTQGAQLATDLDQAVDAYLTKKHTVGAALEAAATDSFDYTRNVAIVFSVASAGLGLLLGLLLSGRIAGAAGQVARAAQGLARGDLNQRITIRSRDEIGAMATAFREMIGYQQEMARVANAIAVGDLTQDVLPKSDVDVLGIAFGRMTRNLRELVGQLEQAIARANRLLEKNRRLHDRLRQAARRTTTLNEQALRRIGADLHDGPCQALALALLRLETLKEHVGLANSRLADDVGIIAVAVKDGLDEVRAISAGLRLPELAPLAVADVAERALREHERRSGVQVQRHLDAPVHAPLAIKIALFRTLQEALSNATRHGGGAAIAARVWTQNDELCLAVSDRGCGFVPELAEKKGRLGLASMRERAELLGGTMCIESRLGYGTTVRLAWPLHEPDDRALDNGAVNALDNGAVKELAAAPELRAVATL
jgi:signal transduction histidine kinase